MFTRTLRQSFRRQEGQALVLAALMVLVMSIAVLTTVNIGQHVHERIRLQNTADAAAYSMAAMEARAFNFYAFANRTQVSHYVSAMMWQSLLSLIYSAEAFFTDLYGFMKTLNPCAGDADGWFWTVACPILENVVPYLSQVLRAVGQIIDTYKNAFLRTFQRVLRAADPDSKIGKWLIPAHRVLNGVMYFAAKTVMVSAHTHVGQTTQTVIDDNDSNLAGNTTSLLGQLATGLYSACLFDQSHYDEAGGRLKNIAKNPFQPIDPEKRANDDREARAKKVMGNITNATRYGCDAEGGVCPEKFVTSRQLGDLIPLPDSLGFIADFLNQGADNPVFRFKKMGQTRMLTHGFPGLRGASRDSRNYIRDWNDNGTQNAWGMLAQGDNMGSDDIYWLGFGPPELGPFDNPFACDKDDNYRKCWGDNRYKKDYNETSKLPYRFTMKTSIWAMNKKENTYQDGGVHWRVNYDRNTERWRDYQRPRGSEGEVGVHKEDVCVLDGGIFGCIVEVSVYAANVVPVQDGNHPWGGVVPFMHFEPGQFGSTCSPTSTPRAGQLASRNVDFNQPTTWVALNKTPEQVVNRENKDNSGTNAPALLNDEGNLAFKFNDETDELDFKNERKKFLMMSGLNVISRGQSYYHRPGNWAEQPNFFNPYWRPRLASVYQGRNNLPEIGRLTDQLPGALQGILPKIMTH